VGADVAKRRTAAVAVDRCVSAGNPEYSVAAAPAPARATPPPAVVQVGVRQDYIVQAEERRSSAQRRSVRVGGVVTG